MRDEKAVHYDCPACGAPLYAWTAAHDPLDRGKRIVLDRCENCGLAVTRAASPPDSDEIDALLTTEPDGSWELIAGNRHSFQGGIGGAQWAGLEPEIRRLHLNPESARLLLAKRGLIEETTTTPFSNRAYRQMIQTFINAFTLRDNFFVNARAGRIPRTTAKDRFAYWLDALVSALVLVPAAMLALPLELLSVVFARGGIMIVSGRRDS